MKAISLIVCLLLPLAVVGSIFRPKENLMVNQNSLDFIDQYPNDTEDVKPLASTEDKKSKNLNYAQSTEEDGQMKNAKVFQETNQMHRQSSTQDRQIDGENQAQSDESRDLKVAESREANVPKLKADTSTAENYETQKRSSDEVKPESQSSESRNTEAWNKSQKTRSKTYETQDHQEKNLLSDRRSEEQFDKYTYLGRKKLVRQMSGDENMKNQETDKQSSERDMSQNRSSEEDTSYRSPKLRKSHNKKVVRKQKGSRSFKSRSSEYQSDEFQIPEDRNYKYQPAVQQNSKRSKTLSKNNKYGTKYDFSQNRAKFSEESLSEESQKIQRDSPREDQSNTDYIRQLMLRNQQQTYTSRSELPRSTNTDPFIRYISSQYPVNMPQFLRKWMPNAPMLSLPSMETEQWKHFFIPANNTGTSAGENKARDIERIYEQLKDQEKSKGKLPNATELIKKNFQAEEHTVKTDDGYILTMFRIVPSMPVDNKRPPVLLMHGLFGSADDWLLMGRERSLAYLLVKAGHEVWLGNARGNKYSRRHVAKHPAQREFWQFSNDEVALHDLPAMIDLVLDVSKQEKVVYVGYTQGSADFFALASTRPEYNNKVMVMYALSPMVYMSGTRSPFLKMIAPKNEDINILQQHLRDGRFDDSKGWLRMAGSDMCEKIIGSNRVCSNIRFIMSGLNMNQIDTDMAAVIMSYTNVGVSAWQLKQVGQMVDSQEYRRFDLGGYMNSMVYGSPQPPEYELSRVTLPVAIYYGAEDWLVAAADVQRLQRALPHAAAHALPSFTAMDMLYGNMAPTLLYTQIVDSINNTINKN